MDTPAIVDDHVQEPVEPPHSLTLKEFVSKLKELEAFHLDSIYEDHIFFDDYAADMMLSDIQYMAEDFLITDTGACHWDNINALKDAGYNVTPGEQDSSGWLTGCIHTQKGIILAMGRHGEISSGGVSYNIMCQCGWGFNGNPDRMKKILAMHASRCDQFTGANIPKGLENVIGNFPNQKKVQGILYSKDGTGKLFDASNNTIGKGASRF